VRFLDRARWVWQCLRELIDICRQFVSSSIRQPTYLPMPVLQTTFVVLALLHCQGETPRDDIDISRDEYYRWIA